MIVKKNAAAYRFHTTNFCKYSMHSAITECLNITLISCFLCKPKIILDFYYKHIISIKLDFFCIFCSQMNQIISILEFLRQFFFYSSKNLLNPILLKTVFKGE